LSIRIADEEWDKLHALAEAEGVSSSDYVRLFIRRAYAEKFCRQETQEEVKAGPALPEAAGPHGPNLRMEIRT
jgi:predicted DNA-binding protein